ncbi:hypothetical protein EW145_g7134 [Phellinidium pouzarii]|uniref:C2H2-type domain-containing protein n=1 Tax=Phellinidium pouzarii TaxID=167371 RepID=A0A4S4KNK5_9AGAM|nr:hypothetical protein EW145_g7134 [Phellinidium pouzarii]
MHSGQHNTYLPSCQHCYTHFETENGVSHHLAQKHSCREKEAQRLAAVSRNLFDAHAHIEQTRHISPDGEEIPYDYDMMPLDAEMDTDINYHLLAMPDVPPPPPPEYATQDEDENDSPFVDEKEWDLAKWIMKSLGKGTTDELLKTDFVHEREPSFHNAQLASKKKYLLREPDKTLELLQQNAEPFRINAPAAFITQGLRPMYPPFWADLPHCNIFAAITPDLLHQLHKGVFKDHLCVPAFTGLRQFKKGITSITQWTGKEHKQMQRVFVALVSGCIPAWLLRITRALVDFIFYARFQSHTTNSLHAMQAALNLFHADMDKVVKNGIHKDMELPKFASLVHYCEAIMALGTVDSFNTEWSERQHIETKEGF